MAGRGRKRRRRFGNPLLAMLWPFKSRNITARTDLPAYELNECCADPFCAYRANENHHIAGRKGALREAWWGELPDGQIVPLRVGLCSRSHSKLTGEIGGHKAQLVWDEDFREYAWDDFSPGRERRFLDPPLDATQAAEHPPLRSVERGQPAGTDSPDGADENAPLGDTPTDGSQGVSPESSPGGPDVSSLLASEPPTLTEPGQQSRERDDPHGPAANAVETRQNVALPTSPGSVSVAPGTKCPSCERRVPHERKPTTPKTKTVAYRVPVDDAPTHIEMVDAVAEHLGVADKPYHRWAAITMALAIALQTPIEKAA